MRVWITNVAENKKEKKQSLKARHGTRESLLDNASIDRISMKASMSAQYFTIKSDIHGPADTRIYAIFIERSRPSTRYATDCVLPWRSTSSSDLVFVERRFTLTNIHAKPCDAKSMFINIY